MKTNVNMIRKMGDFQIVQRTKDGMFNATDLLSQWNSTKGNANLRIEKFLSQKKTKEFIIAMGEEFNGAIQPKPDTQIITKTKAKTNSKGIRKAGEVWMHPYLFIKFAMWLNTKFELQVIKFVYDQLIEFRHEAGDLYKDLGRSASKFEDTDYSLIGKGLNYIVFGRHENGIRQKASETELSYMNEVQKNLAFSIDMGLITSFSQLIESMRVLYHKRHTNLLSI